MGGKTSRCGRAATVDPPPRLRRVPPVAGGDGYREVSRRQWDAVAPAWYAWRHTVERWLGRATELMLDAARVGHGVRVLDVAAGAGGQSIAAARRGARVVAIDFSAALLAVAARVAEEATVQLETLVRDGEQLGIATGSVDAVISRLGFQYFADPVQGVREAFRVLRPGGRFSAITFTTAGRNGFVAVPVGILRAAAGREPPAPGAPGPFALADGRFEAALAAAGFVEVTGQAIPAPLRLASAAECIRFEQEAFGALRELAAVLPPARGAEVWGEVEDALASFVEDGRFAAPCELQLVSAVRP